MLNAIDLTTLKPAASDALPKSGRIGYLAPDVGTYFIDFQKREGTASFVWSHHLGEDVDFHSGRLQLCSVHQVGDDPNVQFYVTLFEADQTPLFILLEKVPLQVDRSNLRIVFARPVGTGRADCKQLPPEGFLWAWNATHFHGHDES